jgi:LysR family transcriptional regulator, hydrogen peroxide-inducible genes activator
VAAVAKHRHFGRAAAACGVSQPALSAQVRKLEAWLGFAIFERLPGKVMLTPAGATFAERAADLVAAARDLIAGAGGAASTLTGPFRLGAIPTLGPYLLPRMLRPIRAAYPILRLVLSEARTDDLVAALRSGGVDAALVCTPIPDPALTAHALFYEPMLIVHPADEEPEWPPRPGRLLLLEDGHCLRDQVLAACAPVPAAHARHATGLEILRHMVAVGEGVSLIPVLATETAGSLDGLLRYSEPPGAEIGRDVVLLVRRNDPRAALLAEMAELFRRNVPLAHHAEPGATQSRALARRVAAPVAAGAPAR